MGSLEVFGQGHEASPLVLVIAWTEERLEVSEEKVILFLAQSSSTVLGLFAVLDAGIVYTVLLKYARPSLKKTSSVWEPTAKSITCIFSFCIYGAFLDV